MKIFILILAVLVWNFPLRGVAAPVNEALPAAAKKSVRDLIVLLRSKIPSGWTVSFDENESTLEIDYPGKVLARFIPPSSPAEIQPSMEQYSIIYQIRPFVPKTRYDEWKSEDEKFGNEMRSIEERAGYHGSSKIPFDPKTISDKHLRARYERLATKLHDLPVFHFEEISLKEARFPSFYVCPVDAKIEAQCEATQSSVEGTLIKY